MDFGAALRRRSGAHRPCAVSGAQNVADRGSCRGSSAHPFVAFFALALEHVVERLNSLDYFMSVRAMCKQHVTPAIVRHNTVSGTAGKGQRLQG